MKKIVSLILALVMVMGLAVSASAASITINSNVTGGTTTGETYTAYKVFDATISDQNVAYTIVGEDVGENEKSQFYDVIASYTYNGVKIFTLTEIGTTGVYNVEVHTSFTQGDDEAKQAAAKDLAAKLKVAANASTATSDTGTFTNLATGYYLITDTLGSALIVDTLGDVAISTKNAYPSLEKKILVGSAEEESVTADRGDEITFKITVKIPETVNDNIIIHDTLDEDMTYVPNSVDGEGASYYTEECGVEECNDIHFLVDYKKAANGVVEFTYKATLNRDAETAEAHTNVANLTYSAFTSTDTPAVNVYTYEVDVYKWTGVNTNGLAGAGFKLKNADGQYYTNTNGVVTWTDNGTQYETAAERGFTEKFEGIAAGTYTLEESKVPDGYNKANDITVVIGEDGTVSIKTTENGQEVTVVDEDKKIEVENKTGSELPSTGGIGTTLFYVIGGLLMAGAVVLLITKKRMA